MSVNETEIEDVIRDERTQIEQEMKENDHLAKMILLGIGLALVGLGFAIYTLISYIRGDPVWLTYVKITAIALLLAVLVIRRV